MPARPVNTTSDITRGFSNAIKSDTAVSRGRGTAVDTPFAFSDLSFMAGLMGYLVLNFWQLVI